MLYKTKARALAEAVVVNPAFPPPVQPGTPAEMAALAAIPAANASQNETEVKRLAYTAYPFNTSFKQSMLQIWYVTV